MCTNVAHDDFLTVHHELGHIEYFLQYKHQPITFREGGNPGRRSFFYISCAHDGGGGTKEAARALLVNDMRLSPH